MTRVWGAVAPSLPLLPILVAYVLVSVLTDPRIATDEVSFLSYAHHLTHGFYADTQSSDPGAYLWHGPALPALLVPLVALHFPLALMRVIVGSGLLFATMVAFHRLARHYMPNRAALMATYGLALYLPFFVVNRVYVEPLATLSLTLVALFIVRSFRGGRWDHLWAGAAFALLALSRIEFGYVLGVALVLSLVWLVASRRSLMARRSVVATVLALILCTPWLIYTYSLTGRPFYWSNSGGLSLYWMTAPGNLGDFHRQAAAFTHPQLAASRNVFTEVARLAPLDQDPRLQHIALQNIGHNPKHYLANVVNNLDRLVFNSPYSFTNEKASSMLYAVPNALLLSLLAIALWIGVRLRRRLAPEVLPLAVLALLGFVIHVPVAAYARFVIPLVPLAAGLVVAVLGPHVRVDGSAPR